MGARCNEARRGEANETRREETAGEERRGEEEQRIGGFIIDTKWSRPYGHEWVCVRSSRGAHFLLQPCLPGLPVCPANISHVRPFHSLVLSSSSRAQPSARGR